MSSATQNKQELISLEELKIPIRDVWRREDSDFTPWLKDNIGELGAVLGLDLKVLQSEAPVGGFSLDLLGQEENGKCFVAIENQFGRTDHDHLGKCLTYAAAFQAKIIIWVTEELRDEHRQAVRYFNERDKTVKFYVVVVEVFQINESRRAYQFSPFVDSSNWVRLHSQKPESISNQVCVYYHNRLKSKLAESDFSVQDSKICTPMIWFYLDNARTTWCYHRVNIDEGFYVGIHSKNALIIEELKKQKGALDKQLDCLTEWSNKNFNISGDSIPRIGVLNSDSMMQESVDLLKKFDKFVFPRVRKALEKHQES